MEDLMSRIRLHEHVSAVKYLYNKFIRRRLSSIQTDDKLNHWYVTGNQKAFDSIHHVELLLLKLKNYTMQCITQKISSGERLLSVTEKVLEISCKRSCFLF